MKHYFLADSHIGCRSLPDIKAVEEDFIKWIREKGAASDTGSIYLMGDIFDFWFEFAHSIPHQYDRVLTELKKYKNIHFIPGNHDQWTYGYLEKEIGLIVHKKVSEVEIGGKSFTLAHGHSLNAMKVNDRITNKIFESSICRWAFRHLIIPRLGIAFGMSWSARTHLRHNPTEERKKKNDDQFIDYYAPHSSDSDCEQNMDEQLNWVKENGISTDYVIMGHRHKGLNIILRNTHLMILNDFFAQRSYAVYDDETETLEEFAYLAF